MIHSKSRIWLSVILVSALLAGVLAACSPKEPAEPSEPTVKTITLGVTSEAETLDPHKTLSGSCFQVFRHIYDGLVQIDVDASMKPGLAESWTISEDSLVYTFKLRKDVQFTDGTKFDAHAVKFTFDRLLDPATAAPAKEQCGSLKEVKVVDDYTVEFILEEPYAPLLHQLGSYYLGIISPAAVEKWGADYGQHPVGTGPFMLKEWVPGSHILLEPNPNYVNTIPYSNKKGPATVNLCFKTIKDEQTMIAALESNTIQVCTPPLAEVERLSKDPKFQILQAPKSTGIWYIEFNLKKPPVDDIRVRQAIGYATNRSEFITAAFQGQGYEYSVALPNGLFGYDDSIGQQYGFTYNPEKAKQLLAEAGWVDTDGDGIVEKDGQPFKTLMLAWDNPVCGKIVQIIQAQMKAIGIDVEIQTFDWATFVSKQTEGNWAFEAMNWGWSEPALISMMFADYKAMGFFDAEVDFPDVWEQVKMINSVGDPDERIQYIHEALKLELQHAIFVPIGGQASISALRAEVKDVLIGPFNYFSYVDAHVE